MMVALKCDPYQTASLIFYGEWSRDEVEQICDCLKPGDIALDIGANIGTVAVAMAKKVGRAGYVMAFEPQRAAFCCLAANTALTHCLVQLEPVRAAVSDCNGVINVPIINPDTPFNVGGMRLDDPDYSPTVKNLPTEEVPCVTIDSMNLPRCAVIKIDVETMESKVLAGAKETLGRCRPVVFAETMVDIHNQKETDNIAATFKLLHDAGYAIKKFVPPLYSPDNIRFCPDSIFPGVDLMICAWPKEKEFPEWFSKLEPAMFAI
jgi:FkbM family methyltransferase